MSYFTTKQIYIKKIKKGFTLIEVILSLVLILLFHP